MDKNEIIKLLTPNIRVTSIGQRVEDGFTEREVFARKTSISQSEFFTAGQNGMRADCRFDVYSFEYDGQKNLSHNGIVYTIYRTYVNGDDTELYCEVRKQDGKH